MKILVTGGSGLLGTEILKLDQSLIAPTQQELDVTEIDSIRSGLEKYQPEAVLHLAAATKPLEHDKDPRLGITANIIGTANVALACAENSIRLVYTSTDYLYHGPGPHKETEPVYPPYKFAWSKLGGEAAASMLTNYLILRLSFGPVPFPWEKVYKDQINSKLYVDEVAPLILGLVKSEVTGIVNVGGPRTTLEEYARRTKSSIETIEKPDWVPSDTSLDISKMKQILDISNEKELLKR